MMDAASAGGDVVPKEDDLSLCMNCGALYQLHAGKWATMSAAEFEALPSDTRADVTRHRIVRQVTIKTDLTKRDRWA